MKIDTKIVKKVLYRIDPSAKFDEDFVENINMILLLMEQEQVKQKRERSGRGGGSKTRGSSHGMSGGSLTLIGSPNFGCRSVERDFESSLLIVTEDKELKIEMEREINQLMAYTSPVEATTFTKKGRKLSGLFNWSHGWWISPASRLVKGFM